MSNKINNVVILQYDIRELSPEDVLNVMILGDVSQTHIDNIYKVTYSFDVESNCSAEDSEIAEYVWKLLNSDNRPNKNISVSMNVGDIVVINNVPYVCNNVGFKKCDCDVSNLIRK